MAIVGAVFTLISVCYASFYLSREYDTLVGRSSTAATALLAAEADVEGEELPNDPGYQRSFFHASFAFGSMYMAMLLTNWVISFVLNQRVQQHSALKSPPMRSAPNSPLRLLPLVAETCHSGSKSPVAGFVSFCIFGLYTPPLSFQIVTSAELRTRDRNSKKKTIPQ